MNITSDWELPCFLSYKELQNFSKYESTFYRCDESLKDKVSLQKISLDARVLVDRLRHVKRSWRIRLGPQFGLISFVLPDTFSKLIATAVSEGKKVDEAIGEVYEILGSCEAALQQLEGNLYSNENKKAGLASKKLECNLLAAKQTYDRLYHTLPWAQRTLTTRRLYLTASCFAFAYLLYAGRVNWNDIQSWANSSFAWLSEHLLQPVSSIIGEVFLQQVPQIVDEGVLEDANSSLRSMIRNYKRSNSSMDFAENKPDGNDISVLSKSYEQQIRSPIWNALNGSLIELILIQVQQLKVEGLTAMKQLDRLLRENQFNTQLISMIPAVLSLYLLKLVMNQVYSVLTDNSGQVKISKQKQGVLIAELVAAFAFDFEALQEKERLRHEGRISYHAYQLHDCLQDNGFSFSGSLSQRRFLEKSLKNLLGRKGYQKIEREKLSQILLQTTKLI
mmetsp:Transcript_213/g.341  ORF Transcript_213/g.341 Transcript_213/m.341 type:complete len:448 (+) Transcript_213:2122-3465(+)